jgi:DNA sulfur modification protein DndD
LDNKSKGKDVIRDLNQKIQDWGIKLRELKEYLNALNETRKEEIESLNLTYQNNIFLCDKLIEDLTNQLAEATNTVEFKNKALVLKSILKQITETSMLRLKEDILTQTNQRINKILGRKDIKISTIGKCLTLSDRDGVSVGQELSIAYAFLSTLFSQSPHELPFIVDTPAAPLDLEVRREVAEILPNLFSQVVVFITSSERNNFADQYYSRDDCVFLTIKKEADKVTLVDDLNFFQNFQSEELNGL